MKTLRVSTPLLLAALGMSLLSACCSNGSDDASPATPSSSAAASSGPDLSKTDNWERRVHEEKGFAFYIPSGSVEKQEADGTTTVYLAAFPEPNDDVQVVIAAIKEPDFRFPELKTLFSKLLELADGGKDQVLVEEEKLNDSFVMVESTYVNDEGEKHRARGLLVLDVTDRYIVFGTTDDKSFKSQEANIDRVLANFEMVRSGKGSAGDEPKPRRAPAKRSGGGTAGGGAPAPASACAGMRDEDERSCPLAPLPSGRMRYGLCLKQRCVDKCGPKGSYEEIGAGASCVSLEMLGQ